MRVNQDLQLVPEEFLGDPIPRSTSISSSNEAACGKTISRIWQQMKKTVSELGFLSNQSSRGRFSNSRRRNPRARDSEKWLTSMQSTMPRGTFISSSWERSSVTSVRNRTVPIPIQDSDLFTPNYPKDQLDSVDMDYNMNSTSRISMNQPRFDPCDDPSVLADLSVKSDGWYEDNQILEDQLTCEANSKSFQMSKSLGTSGFATFMRGFKWPFYGKDKATVASEPIFVDDQDHESKLLEMSPGLGRNYQGIDLSLPSKKRLLKRRNMQENVSNKHEDFDFMVTEEADEALDDTAKTDEIEIPMDETITLEKSSDVLEDFESRSSDTLNQVLAPIDSGVCMDMDQWSQTDDEHSMYSLQDIDGALHAICDDEVLIAKPTASVVCSAKIPELRLKLLRSCAIVGALTKDGRELSPREMVDFEHQKPLVSTFQTI